MDAFYGKLYSLGMLNRTGNLQREKLHCKFNYSKEVHSVFIPTILVMMMVRLMINLVSYTCFVQYYCPIGINLLRRGP